MRALLIALMMAAGSQSVSAYSQPSATAFEWPKPDPNVIPDARLASLVSEAREAARAAETRAREGRQIAAQARRREHLRDLIGRDQHPQTIDAGTIMTATAYDGESAPMLGTVTYPSGANMVGLFGPDMGFYTAAPESLLVSFTGWVFGARTSTPQPMDGVFSFRSGERFTGQLNGATGIYEAADGERRFVGHIDLDHGAFRPTAGILEDRSGRLLAIVRP